jgi:hypothetical protein
VLKTILGVSMVVVAVDHEDLRYKLDIYSETPVSEEEFAKIIDQVDSDPNGYTIGKTTKITINKCGDMYLCRMP